MNSAHMLRTISILVCLVLLATLPAGCGSDVNSGAATMTVRLVDAPIEGYKEININVQEVRIHRDNDNGTDNATDNDTDSSGWITLSTPNRTVNLLDLTGGVSTTLADNVTIPAGHYTQLRLILGAGNTVKLADDSVHDLTVPSGLQSGIKLTVNFDVEPGTTKDVFIDFDAARSIQLHKTGHSNKYILRPTVRAFDKIMTGSIFGTLTDNATGLPLVGAIVTAQTVDNTSTGSIARSTATSDNGSYVLDLLPIGGTYYAVSQPVIGTVAYESKISPALILTSDNATAIWNASFAVATSTGSISGTITPAAAESQSDTVYLIQTLSVGGSSLGVIVRTATPIVADAVETYAMTGVPAGSYTVKGTRGTTDNGTTTVADSLTVPAVTVDPATPAIADLAF